MKENDKKRQLDLERYKEQQRIISQQDYFKKAARTNSPSRFLSEYQLHNTEYGNKHSPYSNEKRMLEAISNGDSDAFLEASETSFHFSYGQMSSSVDKSLEYQCVIGVSLFARATIEGGVDPQLAYDLNDLFLQRISQCSTYEDYMAVMADAVDTFFKEVQRAKAKNIQSVHIEKAKQYIANHLNKSFTIQDLADYLFISKAYLMRLFRKCENSTVTDYIHYERIAAAKNMLKYSDYSIEEISNYLQFSTQSYFGSIFKKLTGMTPLQYRNINFQG